MFDGGAQIPKNATIVPQAIDLYFIKNLSFLVSQF